MISDARYTHKGKNRTREVAYAARRRVALSLMCGLALVLVWRAVDLQVMNHDFLRDQGALRQLRTVPLMAHRGMITDRNGEPLAVSTPVHAIWAHPGNLLEQKEHIPALAELLDFESSHLLASLERNKKRKFLYLRRQVTPELKDRVRALFTETYLNRRGKERTRRVKGVGFLNEYRRYYPAGESAGHLLGFTNVDDEGQEGIELAYNDWLAGSEGHQSVVLDGHRQRIARVGEIEAPVAGKSLALTLDRRLQFLLYRELKTAVIRHQAKSGSAVLLDAKTGEVLAMANQPTFNPNSRKNLRGSQYRNRVMTDVFEPGSTIKPFIVASGIEAGNFHKSSTIDTGPGWLRVRRKTIRDHHALGTINMQTLLSKSSNVGATLVAQSLEPEQLWNSLVRFGFGNSTSSGFPGESGGMLAHHERWHPMDHATLGYGYGISVTALQLARAYAVLANDGYMMPVSLLSSDEPQQGVQVLDSAVAQDVRHMLEAVVASGGTGTRAAVPGYRVAGKTGTVHKATAGGYAEDRYLSLFAGMAPASDPRLVLAIMIDEPSAGDYFGGLVAAPIFSSVMAGALRLLDIPPDAVPTGMHVKSNKETLVFERG